MRAEKRTKNVATFAIGALLMLSTAVWAGAGGAVKAGAKPTAGQGITVSGSRVTCAPASTADAGCVTAGTQTFGGYKEFALMSQHSGAYDLGGGLGTYSIYALNGTATKRLTTPNGSDPLTVLGRLTNTDTAADVVIQSAGHRDAGYALAFRDENSTTFAALSWAGDIVFGPSLEVGGVSPTSLTKGSLIDNSGLSGHVALQSSDGLYLTLGCKLGGGYGGVHGCIAVGPMTLPDGGGQMDGGFLFEVQNGGNSTDKKLLVDVQGGISQLGAYQTNTLQQCGRTGTGVALTGANDGTLMYTVDDKRWHRCNAADAGWPLLAAESTQFYQYADTGRDVASISAGRCTDYSKSVSGTAFAAGDSCTVGFPRDTVGGVSETQWTCWPSDNTVISVRVCCNSTAACDPSNQTVYYNLTCPDGSCYP